MYTCRECENEINQATELCPHCGADLTAPIPGADAPAPKAGFRKILIRWGILLGVLLGAICSFLWFVVPERQGNPTVQAEGPAAETSRAVRPTPPGGAVRPEGYLPVTVHPRPGGGRRLNPLVRAPGPSRQLWL